MLKQSLAHGKGLVVIMKSFCGLSCGFRYFPEAAEFIRSPEVCSELCLRCMMTYSSLRTAWIGERTLRLCPELGSWEASGGSRRWRGSQGPGDDVINRHSASSIFLITVPQLCSDAKEKDHDWSKPTQEIVFPLGQQ